MSISIDARNMYHKAVNDTATNSTSVAGTVTGSKVQGSSSTVKSIGGNLLLQKVKGANKKKMSPDAIARKIAKGSKVSKEEIEYLRETNPELFRVAMRAKRIRENLENSLKSAASDTAKASAVADAISQANFLVAADEKSDGSSLAGVGLYTEAIQAAIEKYGSKKLGKEMDSFIKSGQSDSSDESDEEDLLKSETDFEEET